MTTTGTTDPQLMVIYGGAGALARTKLLPAMFRLTTRSSDRQRVAILAIGTKRRSDSEYRGLAVEELEAAGVPTALAVEWADEHLYYETIDAPDSTGAPSRRISGRIEALERRHSLPGNRLLYLALEPGAIEQTLRDIADQAVADTEGWVRIVVEKPFGRDLNSARSINASLHRLLAERSIFRIDHYLGKETVQNLLVFRFANALFERTWNRDHIESVEITVAESGGVDGRGEYYDSAGVIRDMLQNHLTQLLALVAMEPPVSMAAPDVRSEKMKVLSSVSPIRPDDVVLGQYSGYAETIGVGLRSTTPTFVAVRLRLNTWRWQGVPFLLRVGKQLPRSSSHILVRYRKPPVCMFHANCPGHKNVLLLRLQPDEGFDLFFDMKDPGGPGISRIPLSVSYNDHGMAVQDAYETLLNDVMHGDRTLFVSADEVELAWDLYAPLLEHEGVDSYERGTWGPMTATALAEAEGSHWSEATLL